MSSVTLLDVGHGNCAIVRAGTDTAVVDCPTGALLLHVLEEMGVNKVEVVIVSHADRDHIAGVVPLLTSDRIQVGCVYVNPDGPRRTKTWHDFRYAVAVDQRNGSCKVITSLSTTMPGTISLSDVNITVVSPSAALSLTAIGGETLGGKKVTSNTLSGVLRVETSSGGNGVLLAGDMDEISLDSIITDGFDLAADVLIFPHHGGLSGTSDPKKFAAALLSAVNPKTVIFSNGRGRHDNPRPEIVAEARDFGCMIACTQLSERCHGQTVADTSYLEPIRAQGKHAASCCAGSVTLNLEPAAMRDPEACKRHQGFITNCVATPMCRGGKIAPL